MHHHHRVCVVCVSALPAYACSRCACALRPTCQKIPFKLRQQPPTFQPPCCPPSKPPTRTDGRFTTPKTRSTTTYFCPAFCPLLSFAACQNFSLRSYRTYVQEHTYVRRCGMLVTAYCPVIVQNLRHHQHHQDMLPLANCRSINNCSHPSTPTTARRPNLSKRPSRSFPLLL